MELRASRVTEILEKIRSGYEMDVELATQVFAPQRPLPKRSQRLRFWLSLLGMDLPFLSFFSRRVVKRMLPFANCDFVPGFRCLFGNIASVGSSLHDACFVDYAPIYIGSGAGFSYQNMVITSTHDMSDFKSVMTREIVIGENVWITSRVIILPGVHIGRNSVIGAGSVVSRDIPPDSFAAGNPARAIKKVKRG